MGTLKLSTRSLSQPSNIGTRRENITSEFLALMKAPGPCDLSCPTRIAFLRNQAALRNVKGRSRVRRIGEYQASLHPRSPPRRKQKAKSTLTNVTSPRIYPTFAPGEPPLPLQLRLLGRTSGGSGGGEGGFGGQGGV